MRSLINIIVGISSLTLALLPSPGTADALAQLSQKLELLRREHTQQILALQATVRDLREELNKLNQKYNATLEQRAVSSDEVWFLKPYEGVKGEKGDIGVTGAPGSPGQKGNSGQEGQKGAKGDTGPMGPKGKKGDRGSTAIDALAAPAESNEVSYVLQATLRESVPSGPCGGYIELQNEAKIVYKLPYTFVPEQVGCVWVVWAKDGGPIRAELLNDGVVEFASNFTVLALNQHANWGYNATELSVNQPVTFATNGSQYSMGQYPYIVIHFTGQPSKPGQGLHLKLSDDGGGFARTLKPKQIVLPDAESSTKYPSSPALEYGVNERVFIIGQANSRRESRVIVNQIHTEYLRDWVQLSWLDPATRQARSVLRFGRVAQEINVTLPPWTPFVLVFKSDAYENGKGFTLSRSFT